MAPPVLAEKLVNTLLASRRFFFWPSWAAHDWAFMCSLLFVFLWWIGPLIVAFFSVVVGLSVVRRKGIISRGQPLALLNTYLL